MNQWAEPAEISRAIGVAKSIGENGGALLGLAGSELILRARLPLGPKLRVGGVQLVFFLPALAGLAWSLLFVALVPAAPAAARDRAASSASAAAAAPVVWRSLLFGRVQLVIYCNHAASAWLSYLLLTELPTFAEEALGLEGAFSGALEAARATAAEAERARDALRREAARLRDELGSREQPPPE